jgi:hypothetical protein
MAVAAVKVECVPLLLNQAAAAAGQVVRVP